MPRFVDCLVHQFADEQPALGEGVGLLDEPVRRAHQSDDVPGDRPDLRVEIRCTGMGSEETQGTGGITNGMEPGKNI